MNITLAEDDLKSVRTWLIDSNHCDYVDVVPQLWLDQDAPSSETQFLIGFVVLVLCVVHNISAILLVVVFLK